MQQRDKTRSEEYSEMWWKLNAFRVNNGEVSFAEDDEPASEFW